MHKIDGPGATENNRFTEGDNTTGTPATEVSAAWLNAVQSELVKVIESAGLTLKDSEGETGDQLLAALQDMGVGTGQFQKYSSLRTYETGETCRGSDGQFYEFYDRDGDGTVQNVDPTDSANRPHIWMRWDGNRPGQTIPWRTETPPEGYIVNDGDDYSRTDYRRIFDAWGTTHGEGDGETTFGSPDDRGEFLRGWDNGRGVDAGRSLAEHQIDQMQQITASVRASTGGNQAGIFNSSEGAFDLADPIADIDASAGSLTRSSRLNLDTANSPGARTGDSTYPRNNAVNWITKI